MHGDGDFAEREAADFIRQYLVAVARMIGPEESDADSFRKLLDDHHTLVKHMAGVLGDEGGEQKVRAMVPERHALYRDTVVRLVKDFRQEPGRLHGEVSDLLKSRGIKTTNVWNYWLNWELEAAQALGIPGCVRWQMAFEYRRITVLLQVRAHCKKTMKDILAFVRETPIDRHRRERYRMRAGDGGTFNVYHQQLVGDEILAGKSNEAVTEAVLQAVTEFLDGEDSDYTRINDYFRCLAFRPEAAATAETEEAK